MLNRLFCRKMMTTRHHTLNPWNVTDVFEDTEPNIYKDSADIYQETTNNPRKAKINQGHIIRLCVVKLYCFDFFEGVVGVVYVIPRLGSFDKWDLNPPNKDIVLMSLLFAVILGNR